MILESFLQHLTVGSLRKPTPKRPPAPSSVVASLIQRHYRQSHQPAPILVPKDHQHDVSASITPLSSYIQRKKARISAQKNSLSNVLMLGAKVKSSLISEGVVQAKEFTWQSEQTISRNLKSAFGKQLQTSKFKELPRKSSAYYCPGQSRQRACSASIKRPKYERLKTSDSLGSRYRNRSMLAVFGSSYEHLPQ